MERVGRTKEEKERAVQEEEERLLMLLTEEERDIKQWAGKPPGAALDAHEPLAIYPRQGTG